MFIKHWFCQLGTLKIHDRHDLKMTDKETMGLGNARVENDGQTLSKL